MSLDQFLGLTHEIKLIDFLMCNSDRNYSVDELQDFTDIDTSTLNYILPRLEYNGIIKTSNGKVSLYCNELTTALCKAVLCNSFLIAGYPNEVNETNFKKEARKT